MRREGSQLVCSLPGFLLPDWPEVPGEEKACPVGGAADGSRPRLFELSGG